MSHGTFLVIACAFDVQMWIAEVDTGKKDVTNRAKADHQSGTNSVAPSRRVTQIRQIGTRGFIPTFLDF
jgi:hypothetical protein